MDVRVCDASAGTSTTARLSLAYGSGTGPPSVFVKLAGRRLNRLALVAFGALFTEARLAASGVEIPVRHPHLYAGFVDAAHLAYAVVMEDVSTGTEVVGTAATPLDVEAVRDGLEGLARLHAAHWNQHLPRELAFVRPWRLGPVLGLVSEASARRGLRKYVSVAAAGDTEVRVSARAIARGFKRSVAAAATGEQCLLHGDPHPGNTYVRPGAGTGLLDWQLLRLGHWSHDVGYFVVSCLSVEDRRLHERELLRSYLDALGRAGADPPRWEEAWRRYRATPAYGLGAWVHTLSFGTFQTTRSSVAVIGRFATAFDDLETAHAGR